LVATLVTYFGGNLAYLLKDGSREHISLITAFFLYYDIAFIIQFKYK